MRKTISFENGVGKFVAFHTRSSDLDMSRKNRDRESLDNKLYSDRHIFQAALKNLESLNENNFPMTAWDSAWSWGFCVNNYEWRYNHWPVRIFWFLRGSVTLRYVRICKGEVFSLIVNVNILGLAAT